MEDIQKPMQLAEGIYWLGVRRGVRLETNTYLRVFEGKNKMVHLVIDPGAPIVFDAILDRIRVTIGDPHKLRLAFLSNQDPDVGVNMMHFQKANPALTVICTDDVWRLVFPLGLLPANFHSVDKIKNFRARMSTGQIVRFIPIPFCPSRGACMLYDEQSRILFSGPLFGGLMFSPQLFAAPQHWDGIRIVHQIYMPAQNALRRAVESIKQLEPKPKMIAPQHGAIIREDLIPAFLEKMSALPVGLDLSYPTAIDKTMYLEAINEILETIYQQAGPEVVRHALYLRGADPAFPQLFSVDKQGKLTDIRDDLLGDVMDAFKMFIFVLSKDQPPQIQEIIRNAVLTSNWNLPLFQAAMQEQTAASELFSDASGQ